MVHFVLMDTLFVIGSVFGWVSELLFRRIFSQRRWVNPGFLKGPYLPIYGFGTVVLYIFSNISAEQWHLTYKFEATILNIVIIGVLMTLLELIGGLIFIKKMKIKLWDYSNRWGNYKGIICPLFSLIWLIVGAVFFFFLNPVLTIMVDFIRDNLIYTFLVGIVTGAIIVDVFYSLHVATRIQKFATRNGTIINLQEYISSLRDKPNYNWFNPIRLENVREQLSVYLEEKKEKAVKKIGKIKNIKQKK